MFDEVTLPEEEIVNIKFLKREKFHPVTFRGKEYTVVGGDDVDNLIGVDSRGKVWFLDTENEFATRLGERQRDGSRITFKSGG